MAVRGSMHMDIRVIKVADFKSEVKFDLIGCLEDAIASEAILRQFNLEACLIRGLAYMTSAKFSNFLPPPLSANSRNLNKVAYYVCF